LLGTWVEITAQGEDEAMLHRAAQRAFETISTLQSRLNVHDPESDIARLNRVKPGTAVNVNRDTRRVLKAAMDFARASGGAFDPTVNDTVAGDYEAIELLPGLGVRFARAIRVDLGGIAKGYCIDRAVDELNACGIVSGLVNAGGDMRAFGAQTFPLHLRHPNGRQLIPYGSLRNAALATSASYFDHARCAGNVRDGRSGAPLGNGMSISVRARTALAADALAKVVGLLGAQSAPLLARYRARAWVFDVDNAEAA
jgi:thiamine biosynthesis lipoprotein